MNNVKIKIGGANRVIRFGLKPLGDCIEHYNNEVDKFLVALERNPFKAVPLLFYYGLKWGSENEGKIPDFTENDVFIWLEELPKGIQDEVVTSTIQLFLRSVYDNVPTVKEFVDKMDDESKKNLIGV